MKIKDNDEVLKAIRKAKAEKEINDYVEQEIDKPIYKQLYSLIKSLFTKHQKK